MKLCHICKLVELPSGNRTAGRCSKCNKSYMRVYYRNNKAKFKRKPRPASVCGHITKGSNSKYCLPCWKITKPEENGYRFVIRGGSTKGYVLVKENNKYRMEHVIIAEKALGRRLGKGEVVHHINGIKSDNRNNNLLICTNSYHNQLHQRMGKLYMHEHFGGSIA